MLIEFVSRNNSGVAWQGRRPGERADVPDGQANLMIDMGYARAVQPEPAREQTTPGARRRSPPKRGRSAAKNRRTVESNRVEHL